jgi:hypothetical protein
MTGELKNKVRAQDLKRDIPFSIEGILLREIPPTGLDRIFAI